MNKYTLLWFDDECKTLENLVEKASENEIELVGFTNAAEGIAELKKNYARYDGVLLDGLFFRSSEETTESPSQFASSDVVGAIQRLESKKYLPWFILSGQISFKNREHFLVNQYNKRVYDKLSSAEQSQLWDDIKTEADKIPEIHIRTRFWDVLSMCDNYYLDEKCQPHLITIFTSAVGQPDNNLFNTIRKVLESVLIRYYKFGFLPYQFKEPAIQINPSVRFLSGENQKNMRLSQEVFSHNIKTIVSMLCEISQAMSHQPSSINMYINANSPGYLFTGISFVLAEFLLWHKQFIDKNTTDGTKSPHFKILIEESPEGVIQLDEHRNYHCCGILIHYHKLESMQLTIGDTIRISKSNVNNKYDENECPYKTYAQKLEKI